MSGKRASLWSRQDSDRYLAAADQAAADAAARWDGADAARNLTVIWERLSPEERLVIEYLLMMGSTTLVALHNDGSLDSLVTKGLLRKPMGVGTVFMQYHDTTYDVPPAVWQALNEHRARVLPYAPAELERVRRMAQEYLKGKVQVFEPAGADRVAASTGSGPE